jgi:hypothetical protein
MPPTSSFGFADVHTMGAADSVTGNDVDAVTSATSAGISAGALPRETRLTTVVIALVGGTLSSACAAWQSPGVGVALMTLSLLGTWVATARARERPIHRLEAVCLGALTLLGLMPAWRSSSWLLSYDLVAAVVLIAALPWVVGRRGRSPTSVTLTDSVLEVAGSARAVVVGGVDMAREELNLAAVRARVRAPLVGIAIAIPVVVVFLALFVQADAVFAGLVHKVMADAGGPLPGRVLVAVAVAWMVLGLSFVAARRPVGGAAFTTATATTTTTPAAVGLSELLWGVSVVDALFLCFIAVQGVQMAGFAEALLLPGVTYSAVAREGFFQLLTVVVLVVGGVLGAGLWLDRGQAGQQRGVRVALTLLLVLTMGIAATALLRMARYTDAYGLTTLRFHATVLMAWLMAVLLWCQRTAVSGQRGRFVPGVVFSAVAVVLALHVANPDGIIARVNIGRGERLDVAHLDSLSDDALPTIASASTSLPPSMHTAACALVARRAAAAQEAAGTTSLLSHSVARAMGAGAECVPGR